MLQLSKKCSILVASVEKDWRHRRELLNFDPSENLENSMYAGEKIKKTENGVEINKKLFSDWSYNPSKSQKGSYFSISKRIPNWYSKSANEIVSDWDAMYNECIKVLSELGKVI